jgi:hypothetical protein
MYIHTHTHTHTKTKGKKKSIPTRPREGAHCPQGHLFLSLRPVPEVRDLVPFHPADGQPLSSKYLCHIRALPQQQLSLATESLCHLRSLFVPPSAPTSAPTFSSYSTPYLTSVLLRGSASHLSCLSSGCSQEAKAQADFTPPDKAQSSDSTPWKEHLFLQTL